MTDSFKPFLGVLSIIPGLFAYAFYFRDMIAGKTKPHAFSWLIWGLLAGNGFFAQTSANAGAGAWVTGLTSLACLVIFCVAIFKGDTKVSQLDRTLLTLALLSFAMLFVVDDKTIALGITLFATLLGFTMTLRKAYVKPDEETAKSFALNALKFVPAIFALSHLSFLTIAYPVTAGLANAAVVLVVCIRRRQLS